MRRRDLIKLGGVLPFAGDSRRADEAVAGQQTRSVAPDANAAPGRAVILNVALDQRPGPLQIDRIALGQGGLSPEPMWADRVAEIRALRPRLIRVFLQEYFNVLPAPNQYRFETLDRTLDVIHAAGATPLLSINIKPRVLFPILDQDVVEPNDWEEWDRLIHALVAHCANRGLSGTYWEVANEPDIGEDGGCPYRFTPVNYLPYYERTTAAVLRADPNARVGGPALSDARSPILPALLDACDRRGLPLHFVSWHIYDSDPLRIRGTIDFVRSVLRQHPSLAPETILNEWNMSLGHVPEDVRIQPCFVLETAFHMKDAGLDYACYYHIRDAHVSQQEIGRFMSPQGTAFMANWWNRYPQFHGLFDFQNVVRPAYFAFKLLARLTGARVQAESSDPQVHAFAAYEATLDMHNLLFWNFSPAPAEVTVALTGVPAPLRARQLSLDATTASADENARLRPEGTLDVQHGTPHRVKLAPYGITFWELLPASR
jgi:hypothetical protein